MDRGSKVVDVKPFNYDSGQNIDLWLIRFQHAVEGIIPDGATAEQKAAAYLKYLPQKLDDFTLRLFEASENKGDWAELRAELVSKLTNPAEAHKFQDRIDSIKWDGETPFKTYENRILVMTKAHDPEVAENDALFQRETFRRFMAGLPPDYRTYIDMGLPLRSYDITRARERAEKYHDIVSKNDGRSK